MTKNKSKPSSPTAWIDTLDSEGIEAACEEATMDANDEEDQITGLITMAVEALDFPFDAKVMGQVVEVVDLDSSERNTIGLDFIVEYNGGQHRIAAQSVELIPPFPEGAAFLDWSG